MSYKYVVEIGDAKGKSFKILIEAESSNVIGGRSGYWRTLDKGFIRYNSGSWYEGVTFSDGPPRSTITLEGEPRPQGEKSNPILELRYFLIAAGRWGDDTHKGGTGYIDQKAVLTIESGDISWSLVESNEWF